MHIKATLGGIQKSRPCCPQDLAARDHWSCAGLLQLLLMSTNILSNALSARAAQVPNSKNPLLTSSQACLDLGDLAAYLVLSPSLVKFKILDCMVIFMHQGEKVHKVTYLYSTSQFLL